jgi:hypothetical protein
MFSVDWFWINIRLLACTKVQDYMVMSWRHDTFPKWHSTYYHIVKGLISTTQHNVMMIMGLLYFFVVLLTVEFLLVCWMPLCWMSILHILCPKQLGKCWILLFKCWLKIARKHSKFHTSLSLIYGLEFKFGRSVFIFI